MTAVAAGDAPHGPRASILGGHISEYGRDPLAFMLDARAFGDVVPIRFGPIRGYLVYGPSAVEDVLVNRQRDLRKSLGTRMLIPIMGHGLLTAEGDAWLRERRLASPAFHRERISGYGSTMATYAREHTAAWRDAQQLDVHAELMALTLRIVARLLFDADVTERINQVADAGGEVQDHMFDRFSSWRILLPDWVPTPANRRFHRRIGELDEVVYGIVRQRLTDDRDHGDLLSMLRAARDDDGSRMSEEGLRDEVMTLMLAGHETTALALTWAFVLLAQHPGSARRLGAELASVLGGRAPTVDDVPALRYTDAVINETLRLYPPAYVTGRETIRDTRIGTVDVPRGRVLLVSPYASGRDPRWFEEPDAFLPERWLDGLARRLPRGVFYPFGMGPRMCIGSSFAMLEAQLLLASVAQSWRFELVAGQDLRPLPAITLRPRHGVKMLVHPATAVAAAA